MDYIAHVREDGKTQTIKEHLENTAVLAGSFASSFGAESMGKTAGLLHDIGKYSDQFQKRIRGAGMHVDHSTAGAQVALKKSLTPVAFAVAGHHSGLPDGGSRLDTAQDATLFGRKKRKVPECSKWQSEITLPETDLPDWVRRADPYTQSFFIRMLYSCLVDADFLDTEAFMQGEQPRGEYDSLPVLLERLQRKTSKWLESPETTALNTQRNRILRACIDCGRSGGKGLYTLTVPTGGGKTVASLSFALEQAVAQGMDRVIYVIPYTSIIDQTVEVFSEILGGQNVLAHYAGASFQLSEREDLSPEEYRHALAAENWDAPVIVTTAVQFFESLYASHSSKCRKLHNIASSVIIFDEAQTLPVSYLRPCVAAISQLVQHYGASAVLCTATQPELGPLFQEQHLTAKEICPEVQEMYQVLKRTVIRDLGQISQDSLIERLVEQEQVLCVVNRRKLAQDLYTSLPEEGSYCLTTLLCPTDRKEKLSEIRHRLKTGLPCRVVSTSLIEAGVDVDFPAAYREQAGLDSVLQTAGRCNREGREADPFKRPVYLFTLEGSKVPNMLKQQVSALKAAQRKGKELDEPDTIENYFQTLLYKIKGGNELDQHSILDAFIHGKDGKAFPFETVAEDFSFIDAPTKTVYVPVKEGKKLCEELQSGVRSRTLFRRLGQYSIEVYEEAFVKLYQAGALEMIEDDAAILIDLNQYDSELGLNMEAESGQALFIDA